VDNLRETIDGVIRGYAVKAYNGISYATRNEEDDIWCVVEIGIWQGKRIARANTILRIMSNQVVIDVDVNTKPVYEALLQAGIPREKIVLAYAGEEAKVMSSQ
jgi:hypothetical protein